MAYIYNMADTWADAGTTFTAIKMNVTDTASNAASLLMDLQVGGSSRFSVSKDGAAIASVRLTSPNIVSSAYSVGTSQRNSPIFSATTLRLDPDMTFAWATTANSATPDLILARDAANILAQRNGTNAQTFRAYNTFTDASNYERGVFDWTTQSNALTIGTQQAGSGIARSLRLITQGDGNLLFITNSVTRFDVSSLGLRATANLIWTADNTYDIGASGANRPRNIFAGSSLVIGDGGSVQFGTRAAISSPATNVVVPTNNATSAGAAFELWEMTAPAAPNTDRVRIYAEDNGSGKTRLMARFATGAAVQIAIEP